MKREEIHQRLCEIRDNLSEIEKIAIDYLYDLQLKNNDRERTIYMNYGKINWKRQKSLLIFMWIVIL